MFKYIMMIIMIKLMKMRLMMMMTMMMMTIIIFFYQIWLFAGVALVGVSTLPRQMSQLKQKNWSFISFSSNWENTNNEYILVSVVKNLEKNT